MLGKEYYTQDGKKITVDDYGDVYCDGAKLGKVDEYNKFHPSSYGQPTVQVDHAGNIIDANGKNLGRIGGFHNNQIYTDTGSSQSPSSESSGGGFSFFSLFGWLFKLNFNWKFLIVAWIIGMIFCIAMGDAPWD